jgi:EKC/KEOPS complex subunit CGI121/TPRKB
VASDFDWFLIIIAFLLACTLTAFQIAESFRRFGIQDTTTNILAIKVSDDAESVQSHLQQHVEGTLVEFSDQTIAGTSAPAKIKKIYKVDISQPSNKDGAEKARAEAEAFILGAMALKGS